MAIEREFMFDETALATKDITTKLNKLEQIVKKNGEVGLAASKTLSSVREKSEKSGTESDGTTKSTTTSLSNKRRWNKIKMVGKLSVMAKKVKSTTAKVSFINRLAT